MKGLADRMPMDAGFFEKVQADSEIQDPNLVMNEFILNENKDFILQQ